MRFSAILLSSSLVALSLGQELPKSGQTGKVIPEVPAGPWGEVMQGLKPRAFGPTVMGGRISAIAVDPTLSRRFYVASASGGLWKTENGGMTFKPLFDKEKTISLGSVAIDPSNTKTIYVGTGEPSSRNSVSWGDGVYKSLDGGETWKNIGLNNTRTIGKVLVDPKNSNNVFVAATGHLWAENADRGIYRSADGGSTWTKTLYVDNQTGGVDVIIHPSKSNILFASMWNRRRTPYSFTSGGPRGGIYKSIDGGKSWYKINKGMPKGDIGRVGIAIHPADGNRLYATIEAKDDGGTYLSLDCGESWKKVNPLNPRPFYFSTLALDPKDFIHFFVLGFQIHETKDGGKTFKAVPGDMHPDHHAMWVDPNDPSIFMEGNDGGVAITRDGGKTWEHLNNLPIGQYYEASVDMRRPYYIYGGLQDNNVWGFPTQGRHGYVGYWDGFVTAGGDGFYSAADPLEPETVYGSSQNLGVQRTNLVTGASKFIRPSIKGEKLRFNWNAPYFLSIYNSRTIYAGANRVMKSVDRGDHWKAVSPDLTTNDPAKIDKGEGPLATMKSGAETHCTITTMAESGAQEGTLWAGTDDGRLHVTQDGGTNWTEIKIPGVPVGTWVSKVMPSKYEAGRAYVAFDGHRTMDMASYCFVTEDFGKTWKSLVGTLVDEPVYAVREGEKNSDLLLIGTEFGLYVSLDRGANWHRFRNDFPTVAVHDIVIHPRELDAVIATHGRGLYILDVSPLEQMTLKDLDAEATLYKPQDVLMLGRIDDDNWAGDRVWKSPNTQPGTKIFYYLKSEVKDGVKIKIASSEGQSRELSGSGRKGLNFVAWKGFIDGVTAPGTFSVTLAVGGKDVAKTTAKVVEAYLK